MEQLIIKTEDRRLKDLEEIRRLKSEVLYIWGEWLLQQGYQRLSTNC